MAALAVREPETVKYATVLRARIGEAQALASAGKESPFGRLFFDDPSLPGGRAHYTWETPMFVLVTFRVQARGAWQQVAQAARLLVEAGFATPTIRRAGPDGGRGRLIDVDSLRRWRIK
jgi:hypothetical protein